MNAQHFVRANLSDSTYNASLLFFFFSKAPFNVGLRICPLGRPWQFIGTLTMLSKSVLFGCVVSQIHWQRRLRWFYRMQQLLQVAGRVVVGFPVPDQDPLLAQQAPVHPGLSGLFRRSGQHVEIPVSVPQKRRRWVGLNSEKKMSYTHRLVLYTIWCSYNIVCYNTHTHTLHNNKTQQLVMPTVYIVIHTDKRHVNRPAAKCAKTLRYW